MSGTALSVRRMVAAEPFLTCCAPLRELKEIPPYTLLHAGPPYKTAAEIPRPVLHAAAAAAVFEGWTDSLEAASHLLQNNAFQLRPAQDFGVFTPLAFVVSPTMRMLVVETNPGGSFALAPINDGPVAGALRFGVAGEGRLDRLVSMQQTGLQLDDALQKPIPLLPMMKAGLDGGDDLHGRVVAANAALVGELAPRLWGDAKAYVEAAPQFVLNVLMAACAAILGEGANVGGSDAVVGLGGNGVRLGWRIAREPAIWHMARAVPPVGPRLPGVERIAALPAIGDSAVIDACGFGAAALAHAPELKARLGPHCADYLLDARVLRPFVGVHPVFGEAYRIGLDADKLDLGGGIVLAAIDSGGVHGLIGQGVAPWVLPQGREA